MRSVSTDLRLCFPGDCTALGAQGRQQLSSCSHAFLWHLTLCASLPKPSSQALVARLAAGFSRISGCSALGSLMYAKCMQIVNTQDRQHTGTTHCGTLYPFTMGSPNLKATNPISTFLNTQRSEFQMISQTYPDTNQCSTSPHPYPSHQTWPSTYNPDSSHYSGHKVPGITILYHSSVPRLGAEGWDLSPLLFIFPTTHWRE